MVGSATSAPCRQWRCSQGAPCCCLQPCRCRSTGPVGEGAVRWDPLPLWSPSHPITLAAPPICGPLCASHSFTWQIHTESKYIFSTWDTVHVRDEHTHYRGNRRARREQGTHCRWENMAGLPEKGASEAYTIRGGCAPGRGAGCAKALGQGEQTRSKQQEGQRSWS